MSALNLIGDLVFTLAALGMVWGMLLPSAPAWRGDRHAAQAGIIALATVAWLTLRVWSLQAAALF